MPFHWPTKSQFCRVKRERQNRTFFMKHNELLPEPGAVGRQPRSAAGHHQRILVVDDDSAMRRLNTEVLRAQGYAVDSAEDGAIALDKLLHKNYDLLLTDNNMPNMSGVALLQKLHAIGLVLPVIMATGTVPEKKAGEPEGLQPAVILLKPYAYGEMVKAVEEVLASATHK